jgi:hypothetical protein
MKLRNNTVDEFLTSISAHDAVFHYTRNSTALEKILFEDCFKFSSFADANDPHEYKDKMIGDGGWGWEEVRDKADKTCEVLDKLLKDVSFISCCANFFEYGSLKTLGALRSRMWSQYGENHKGICLVFSKEKLISLLREKYKDEMYLFYQDDVDYKEYLYENSEYDSIEINSDSFDGKTPDSIAVDHFEKYKRELLFIKQLDYIDEHEHRIVARRKESGIGTIAPPEFKVSKCLIGVILGDRFPEAYMPTIDKLSKDIGFEYRQLHWESGGYFLLNHSRI